MRPFDRMARRLRGLFRSDRVERDLSDELRHHIELEAEELVRQGWEPQTARREAFRRFGGEERTKERVRDARGGRLLADLVQDVRYAIRSLRRKPGFAFGVLAVLALGIGSATALFAVVHGVLLRPLPYPEPDRLVAIWPATPSQDDPRNEISWLNFQDWRGRTETVAELGTFLVPFIPDWTLSRQGDSPAEVATTWVGGDFFEALAVPPALGRWLTAEDAEEARPAVVLSHDAWERLLGADPAIVGTSIELDFRQMEVVGVMPEGFSYPGSGVEVWAPLTLAFEGPTAMVAEARGIGTQLMVGRLANGAAPETARDELTGIARDLEATFPESNAGDNAATVEPLDDVLLGSARAPLWSLLGAVGFFLLLATVNAANLLLARGNERAGEVALRRSLGASSNRVARQLVTETLAIAAAGGALGVGLALLMVEGLRGMAVGILPRPESISFGLPVLLAALLVTTAVTLLAGLLPALRTARGGGFDSLRDGRSAVGRGGRWGHRRLLVGGEVALAAVLLVGSGLLIRSFDAIGAVDPGFATEGAIAMTLTAPSARYPDVESRLAFYDQILERVRAIPGVRVAGATAQLPIRGVGEGWTLIVPGLYEPPPDERQIGRSFALSPEGFEALGMTLLGGRGFGSSDGSLDPPVAVINETLAREFFQGEDPIGHRISSSGGQSQWEVVGVVEDVLVNGPTRDAPPSFYVPLSQFPRLGQISFVARAETDPLALVGGMQGAVEAVDSQQPITDIITLERLGDQPLAPPRFFASIMTGFAVLALVLASMGIYGVLAYIVRCRAREMGLRAALGATRAQVVGLVVRSGMGPALTGFVLGLGVAGLLSRYLESLLFGIEPLDPLTYAAGGVTLAVAAALACAIPAFWASRVDPMVSLREE